MPLRFIDRNPGHTSGSDCEDGLEVGVLREQLSTALAAPSVGVLQPKHSGGPQYLKLY